MKLQNVDGFRKTNAGFSATVEVVTRPFPWIRERIVRRKVSRELGGFWFFTDTGEHTPGYQMEHLERVAKNKGGGAI